ncbi:MAG: S9 family peptidase [Calditrichaeota bacterium]|nr:S9 family peptidase [Calditrichota bacterium]
MKWSMFVVLALILASAPGCQSESGGKEASATEVVFKSRHIDLQPYVSGFPYSGFTPDYQAGRLFYYHIGDKTELKSLALTGNPDLRQGETISDVDFATRNVWGIRYRAADGNLYWSGDERNDEVINLYRLNPQTRELNKLTEVPYIFGWRWNEDESKVAYVARLGDKEERLGELRLLDLASGEEKAIRRDTPKFRFTWGSPSWRPDQSGAVVSVVMNADRTYGNLAYVDFATGEWKIVTATDRKRSFPSPVEGWISNDEFLYYSNEDGFYNIFSYNVATGTGKQLTHFERDIASDQLLSIDGKKYLMAILQNPIESEIKLINPVDGTVVHSETVPMMVNTLDGSENKVMVSVNSATEKFKVREITVSTDNFAWADRIGLPEGLREKIVHARVERLTYPTFDIDPATGERRQLHAYLYHPDKPLPPNQQMVVIKSFYGGNNNYNSANQILAEAGIYVLSPAPRGSSGFGREFAALNDKDLGGNEIVDVIYAAKFISEKLGIPPERVGVFGGSHGGYATMRLMTFPGEINGILADFDFGFGMSHAGFSDIIHFYENCNIPDWVTLEAGDPATEGDKLRDRSPLYHADQMSGKLLLTHGSNDSRVPIEGSMWMADSLKKYQKDVTLVVFDGQGHGIKGLENSLAYYRAWFKFLETVGNAPAKHVEGTW